MAKKKTPTTIPDMIALNDKHISELMVIIKKLAEIVKRHDDSIKKLLKVKNDN